LPQRQLKQLGSLDRIEPQRPRQSLDYADRRPDIAPLLEPRVPRWADPGEIREVLTAETGRAPARPLRQPGCGRRCSLPAAPQEISQLLAPDAISRLNHVRLDTH
jgi:hypothetical protein